MKYLPLVWAGLIRSRMRTIFTFLSIVVAFLLFGVLHGVSGGLDEVVNAMSNTRLTVLNRAGFTHWMPIAMRNEIARVPGVIAVVAVGYFGGYYHDPGNQLGASAVDMAPMFKAFPGLVLPAAARAAILRDRTGILVGADIAKKFGWKVGDSVTIATPIWAHSDGSHDWRFIIDGIFRFKQDSQPANGVWINYDYFSEAGGYKNMASQYIVATRDPADAASVSREIDALFRNSATPTRTRSQRASAQAQLRRIGNIGFIIDAILGAVLFTLLALTANTMMQSVRERIAELAVLKTFGYSNAVIARLVVLEALLLCLAAAICGLALAALVYPSAIQGLGIGAIPIPAGVLGIGLAIAVCLALVSSLLPLWRALRLDVAAALQAR